MTDIHTSVILHVPCLLLHSLLDYNKSSLLSFHEMTILIFVLQLWKRYARGAEQVRIPSKCTLINNICGISTYWWNLSKICRFNLQCSLSLFILVKSCIKRLRGNDAPTVQSSQFRLCSVVTLAQIDMVQLYSAVYHDYLCAYSIGLLWYWSPVICADRFQWFLLNKRWLNSRRQCFNVWLV